MRLIAECVFRFYLTSLTSVEQEKVLSELGLSSTVDLSSIDNRTLNAVNGRLRTKLRMP